MATVDTGVGLGNNTNSGIFYNKSTGLTTNIGYLDSAWHRPMPTGSTTATRWLAILLWEGHTAKTMPLYGAQQPDHRPDPARDEQQLCAAAGLWHQFQRPGERMRLSDLA